MHHGHNHYVPHQEDLERYWSDIEHYKRSRKGPIRTYPDHRTHSAHPHHAPVDVPRANLTKPRQYMSSAQPRVDAILSLLRNAEAQVAAHPRPELSLDIVARLLRLVEGT
jgi:hypothetical protein